MTPAHTQLENKIDKPFERDVGLADEYKLFFLRASHEKYSEAPRGARPAQAPAAQLAGPRRAFGAPAQQGRLCFATFVKFQWCICLKRPKIPHKLNDFDQI